MSEPDLEAPPGSIAAVYAPSDLASTVGLRVNPGRVQDDRSVLRDPGCAGTVIESSPREASLDRCPTCAQPVSGRLNPFQGWLMIEWDAGSRLPRRTLELPDRLFLIQDLK